MKQTELNKAKNTVITKSILHDTEQSWSIEARHRMRVQGHPNMYEALTSMKHTLKHFFFIAETQVLQIRSTCS
jgi:hypothetical protein